MVQKQDFIYGDTINGKFWNIELLDTNEIITYYGKIGHKPRLSKQSFDNYQEALSVYHTIIQKKISKGYSPIKKDIPIYLTNDILYILYMYDTCAWTPNNVF